MDTRPVIAHVLHRLHYAGAEVLAADLSRKLQARYRFVFYCLDGVGPLGEKLIGEGFEVVDLKRRPGIDSNVAARLGEHIRRTGVALLHAHQYTPFFYAAWSRGIWGNLVRGGFPPILFTEHGRHYPDHRRPKRVLANKVLLRRRDRVSAVGEFVRDALVRNEGIAGRRIEVIHNGIDPRPAGIDYDDAAQVAQARAALRAELGIEPDQPVVLQVARFHPVKDHATAVLAMAVLVEAWKQPCPPPLLLLAGDGDERPRIEALARDLKVQPHVRFLGVRTDVARLMTAADVFCLSSLSEGISVTLLEAMAARLPIAATDVGGNPEVVEHQSTGLLSPRSDAHKLAQHLHTLLADADLRKRMGAAGRQRLLNLFTQQRMHAAYERVYGQMTGAD